MSSMTPQDNARNNFPPSSSQNVFRVNTNTSNTSPAQQRSFGRPGMGVLRPLPQQVTYSGPYTSTPPTARSNLTATSAEQQIAQGVLSNNNTPGAPGTNTPQRCPPSNAPLGTSIHMPSISTPSQDQPINVNHTIHPSSTINQASSQRPAQGNLALQQHLNTQQPSISSASETVVGPRPQERTDNETQDMSLIDPQLGVHHQIDPSPFITTQRAPADSPPVVQGEMLSPPPGGSFPTFEALFAFAQAHALAHGYAFVIGRSKRDNRGLKKVFLICDRGGTNKEKVHGEQRQRKTKSRKCGCEFGVFGLENKTAWLLRGRIDGEHLMHNHPPSESPTEHPGARKLDPKAIAAVKALEENGVSVKETLEILHRENPLVRYLPRDIYNARAAIKRDPSRVEASAMEELPTFYKKPPMTFEEKLKAELRTEVANAQAEVEKTKEEWKKEVAELKEQLKQKDKMIQKFEMFIDICNERVMVQRERLAEAEAGGNGADRS